KLHFVHGSHRNWTGGAFDLVTAIDVLEHIEDYRGFLREIRPMGIYKMFHIPIVISAQTAWRKDSLKKRRKDHVDIHYFTGETALFAITDVGYEIVDWRYTPRSVDICNGAGEKILKLPRKLLFAIDPGFTVRFLGGYSMMVLTK